MPLVELHECLESRHNCPVFVNSRYVTFIQKSPTTPYTVVGLIGDDLGCDVVESVREVAERIAAAEDQTLPPSNSWAAQASPPPDAKVLDEVRKPRKARKWHSRKSFKKEAKGDGQKEEFCDE